MSAVIILGLTIIVGAALGLAILQVAHAILIRGIGLAPSLDGKPVHESGRRGTL
jgi:hypothetical protein